MTGALSHRMNAFATSNPQNSRAIIPSPDVAMPMSFNFLEERQLGTHSISHAERHLALIRREIAHKPVRLAPAPAPKYTKPLGNSSVV